MLKILGVIILFYSVFYYLPIAFASSHFVSTPNTFQVAKMSIISSSGQIVYSAKTEMALSSKRKAGAHY